MTLLRNMDRPEGKANGTMPIISKFHDRSSLVEAQVVSGSNVGDIMYIPCIKLYAKKCAHHPFCLIRVQFPVKHAFAMMITWADSRAHASVWVCTSPSLSLLMTYCMLLFLEWVARMLSQSWSCMHSLQALKAHTLETQFTKTPWTEPLY